jgi:hypothetical protein
MALVNNAKDHWAFLVNLSSYFLRDFYGVYEAFSSL